MDQWRSTRIPVHFEAELSSRDKSYFGIIENFSEEGICMTTEPSQPAINFAPESPLELVFTPPSGEVLSLKCTARWYHKTPTEGLTNSIGMEIVDSPPEYQEEFLYCYSSYLRSV